MTLLNRLERKLGRWAVPNITTFLIAGQVLIYVLQAMPAVQGMGGSIVGKIALLPSAVMAGEIWRLVTFLFIPPTRSLLILFYWMLLHLFGSTLEQQWGVVRYNAFLLIGYLANVAAVFVAWGFGSDLLASNNFLYGTVFLAFARLFPNYVLNIMFILPIQIKWLALLAWIGYGYGLLTGTAMSRMLIVASLLNYLLFFGREHWRDFKSGQRRRSYQSKTAKSNKKLKHECLVCGLNSNTSPKTLFRYCSKCAGQCCYCPDHIQNHEHVAADDSSIVEVP